MQDEREANMLCVNPECCSASFDQPGGSLWLMELEMDRDQQANGEDNGFPICTRPTKCFWLCVDCSEKYVLSKWLRSGVVLKPKRPDVQYGLANQRQQATPRLPIRVYASVGLRDEFEKAV
jgi:hypothetical protein